MDTPPSALPAFPYGAVYFRKSNPPREDWERDYRVAAEDGINSFRHWFLWSAIEVAPGQFDWEEYDRQLDLAAENGIKTVIAEFVGAAPEWAFRTLAHARYESRDGVKVVSGFSDSVAVSGFPGLCLDNDDARALGERFLRELAGRYKGHPGLGGYDVWNECNFHWGASDAAPEAHCFCLGTRARFRAWLQREYGDLKAVAAAWRRYSLETWEDVHPPYRMRGYPEVMDWLRFRIENAHELLRWRVDTIRSVDPDHPIVAHGVAQSLANMPSAGCDEWKSAAEVDAYGFTWIAARQGNEPWKHWHAVDLVRAGSRGKPFWHAEAQAGPLWMQPQVIDRPRNDGRIAEPEDVRLWNLTSFAGGARGLFYPRWRPLLDGPLFGAFGAYAMDGSRTPRSEMVSSIARWSQAPETASLWRSRPVRGDIGVVVVPESQLFTYAQHGRTAMYTRAVRGAYRGFFENNIQADWVLIDDIDGYDLLYLPFPVMLSQRTADRLRAWVEQGGTLISEGCPGYFGDGGHVGAAQPNLGLDALFGVRESYVEFTPDLLDDLHLSSGALDVPGGLYLQAYEPTTGTAAGQYQDGRVAVVDHTYGQGRTRLIGTFPGAGFGRGMDAQAREFFRELIRWAGREQHIRVDQSGVVARISEDGGQRYLWVVNHNRGSTRAMVEISPRFGEVDPEAMVWAGGTIEQTRKGLAVFVRGRDAVVVGLREPLAAESGLDADEGASEGTSEEAVHDAGAGLDQGLGG
ncbi:MAG: beta-galactosidase [Chloroflexota bacterium]